MSVVKIQDTAVSGRCKRGINLWLDKGNAIVRIAPHTWLVPSCSGDNVYTVRLDLQSCDCPDHQRAKSLDIRCKHLIAATIANAKR